MGTSLLDFNCKNFTLLWQYHRKFFWLYVSNTYSISTLTRLVNKLMYLSVVSRIDTIGVRARCFDSRFTHSNEQPFKEKTTPSVTFKMIKDVAPQQLKMPRAVRMTRMKFEPMPATIAYWLGFEVAIILQRWMSLDRFVTVTQFFIDSLSIDSLWSEVQ